MFILLGGIFYFARKTIRIFLNEFERGDIFLAIVRFTTQAEGKFCNHRKNLFVRHFFNN